MMTAEIIKDLLKRNGYSYSGFAAALGVTRATVCGAVRPGNMRTDTALRYLGALGYKLVAVPKAFNVPAGAYELTPSTDPIDDRTDWKRNMHGDSDELIG